MVGRDKNFSLFVYGALLRPAERMRLLGRQIAARPAMLRGYARLHARHYFVVPREGAETPGEIVSGLSEREMRILDDYEDVPRLYTRDRIEVVDQDGTTLSCWIYMPTALARGG